MAVSGRGQVIVGNWKMHKTIEESLAYIKLLPGLITNKRAKVYLAVPFTAIQLVAATLEDKSIWVGAQNMNDVDAGAFTGEISAKMLKSVGAQFVILGHSERRRLFHEDNALINRKVKKALKEGLQPLVCIGETLEELVANKTDEVIEGQLDECLLGLNEQELLSLMIAYEPVWAIGTGRVATSEEVEEVHKRIGALIKKRLGASSLDASSRMTILYGGSVTPETAQSLLEQPHIDGLLVGGASLSPETFAKIINVGNR